MEGAASLGGRCEREKVPVPGEVLSSIERSARTETNESTRIFLVAGRKERNLHRKSIRHPACPTLILVSTGACGV